MAQETKEIDLQIGGMHCGACVRRVTTALEKLGGVKVGSVEVGSAHITVDEHVRPEQVVEAINRIGFQAQVRE